MICNRTSSYSTLNKLIIYFLPSNDFGENDYNNWKGSKRYRPYFKEIDPDLYETFIPENAAEIDLSEQMMQKKWVFLI